MAKKAAKKTSSKRAPNAGKQVRGRGRPRSDATASQTPPPGIAAAVGAAATGSQTNTAGPSASAVQDAMNQAILDMQAKGITDDNQIREAMQAARQRVRNEARGGQS